MYLTRILIKFLTNSNVEFNFQYNISTQYLSICMEPLPDNTIPIRFAFHMKFISYLKSAQCASQFHNNSTNTIYNHHMIYGQSLK